MNTPAVKKKLGAPFKYAERLKSSSWRRTDTQAAKLVRLGGDAWLREQIDKAPEPEKKEGKPK